MIYVSLDTNILMYFFDFAYEDSNPLDYLTYWIEQKQIEIILPEIIIEEWERNKELERNRKLKQLKDFFNLSEKVLPNGYISQFNNPTFFELVFNNHFESVDQFIKTKTNKVQLTDELRDKVLDWGLLRKAPMQNKSSLADTIILITFLEFVKKNGGNEFYFISNDQAAFFESNKGEKTIHSDLKDEFELLNIQAYLKIDSLIHLLKTKLPIPSNFDDINIKKKINHGNDVVYNPSISKTLNGIKDNYIEDIKHMDLVLKSVNPSKNEMRIVIGLINDNENYKKYFFNKVTAPIWISILAKNKVFDPQTAPQILTPIVHGFNYTDPFQVIQRITSNNTTPLDSKTIKEIISILNNIIIHCIENASTRYYLLMIICNLPNESVPFDFFAKIRNWYNRQPITYIESHIICSDLLQKYLNKNPTRDDLKKSEAVLELIFLTDEIPISNRFQKEIKTNCFTKIDLNTIKSCVDKNEIKERIIKYFSNRFLSILYDTNKLLLLEYYDGVSPIGGSMDQFEIAAFIGKKHIDIISKDIVNQTFQTGQLKNYDAYELDELENKYFDELNRMGISNSLENKNPQYFDYIKNVFNSDKTSPLGYDLISQLEEKVQYGENSIDTFILLYRNFLIEYAKQFPEEISATIQLLFFTKKLELSVFKRLGLYIISQNWNSCKSLFFQLLGDSDPHYFFSKGVYFKELYHLLYNNQLAIDSLEKKQIILILSKGPQRKNSIGPNQIQEFKLRWYAALRDIAPFKSKYEKLSKLLSQTFRDYESLGNIQWKPGAVTPINPINLLSMSNAEIVQFLREFNPLDRTAGPNISGLSDTLKNCVQDNPNKFVGELNHYINIYFIYTYSLFEGFKEAATKHIDFSWEKVLEFSLACIQDSNFYDNKFVNKNDGWGADYNWVVGSIAKLLSIGINQEDKISKKLLPTIKKILLILSSNIKKNTKHKITQLDYVSYFVNSTEGVVLRALLDYSLRIARNKYKKKSTEIKWEEEIKIQFENAIEQGIIDSYIIQGMYFYHFYYLDSKWLLQNVNWYVNISENEWLAFWGGFTFISAPGNDEQYAALYPHYERAINNNVTMKYFHTNGLVKHLIAFYFWGLDNLNGDGLLFRYLKNASAESIREFLSIVWQQTDYLKKLDEKEKFELENRIYKLWKFIYNENKEIPYSDFSKVLISLMYLIPYIQILNKKFTQLLILSCEKSLLNSEFHQLFEFLIKQTRQHNTKELFQFVGQILDSLNYNSPYLKLEQSKLITLVEVLYLNKENVLANSICNNVSSAQYEFLIPLYNKFNS